MEKIQLTHSYDDIISVENLLCAWREFIKGKRHKKDVQEFQLNLFDNILDLHLELKDEIYIHGAYKAFKLHDPKLRDIHKATVRDRLLHHAVYRILYPFFDRTFISDSYSCRKGKGMHRALNKFEEYSAQASCNHTKTVWVLKCDIRKFFASIDHETMYKILSVYIPDQDILWLLQRVISSFSSTKEGVGLPLGNLTSQLLVNIYMNEFDQFVKHKLKIKDYIRYADDSVIFSRGRKHLSQVLQQIDFFLSTNLCLTLHPNKIFIKTVASGVDFLGWVNFADHRVLRTSTKRRMFRMLRCNSRPSVLASYYGMLSHGNGYKLRQNILHLI